MNAEIIAVGSEMLTHKRVDTNSLFLTEQLNNLGVEVTAKHVIGDDLERLAGTIRRALGGAQFVLISGGLGRLKTTSRAMRSRWRWIGGKCSMRRSAMGSSSASGR